MKRFLAVLVAFILMSSLLLMACGGSETTAPTTTAVQQSAAKYKFTYSNFFPPTHNNSILAEMWAAEIKKRTNGAVDFSYHPGGSLTPANKIYDGVVSGISDIGMSVISYTPGRFLAAELLELPHGYPNGWVATMVANDFYNQFKPPEFNDVHVLYFHAHGPGALFTTKKMVRSLEDLKGMVLRSTGIGSDIATALGASGYAAAQNEAFELMSKGVIDGSLSPREVLQGWKQAEVVKYVTECMEVGYTADMFVVMNKAKWESLPEDIQKVITEVSQQWIDYHGQVWSAYDKSAMDYFMTFPDREVITLPENEVARWVEAVKPLVDKKIADINAKGLPGDEYEKYINERIVYWSDKAPAEADCVKWVTDNVKLP